MVNAIKAFKEHFGKVYVYNVNGTHVQLIGIYESKEQAILKHPTLSQALENVLNCKTK